MHTDTILSMWFENTRLAMVQKPNFTHQMYHKSIWSRIKYNLEYFYVRNMPHFVRLQ